MVALELSHRIKEELEFFFWKVTGNCTTKEVLLAALKEWNLFFVIGSRRGIYFQTPKRGRGMRISMASSALLELVAET